jgi:hypothetical protein
MAISNYGELQSAVADWAERSDLTARIEDFCRIAHDTIVRELLLTTSLDLDSESVSLPSDCGEVVTFMAMTQPAVFLRQASEGQMTGYGTGVPTHYRIDSGEALLVPTPDVTYTGRLQYRLVRTFFTSDTATNTALTRYPMLYLHGALAELYRYQRDLEGVAMYQASFQAGLASANKGETAHLTQGASLRTSSGVAV